MFDFLKHEKDMSEENPVDIEKVEDLIKIINVCKDIGAEFELCLILRLDGLTIDSSMFKDIKLLKKTKNEPDRLSVSYYNALLSTNSVIDINDIIHINLKIVFADTEE